MFRRPDQPMSAFPVITESPIQDPPVSARGKVRDIYDLGDQLLIVVTDRVSAFDVVFREAIPDKGAILNSISAFWFNQLKSQMPNHMISCHPEDFPEPFNAYAPQLRYRSMLCKKLEMFPVECIVRAYLEGSALKSYRDKGEVNGIRLPAGLRQGDKLPEAIFTPSTKAENGHDVNISMKELEDLVGTTTARELRDKSLELFQKASEYAASRGILLADSKLEMGISDGALTLGDEAFTPDSSRFWAAESWEPGHEQKSFDKQFLREWLSTLDWDREPPAPSLPDDIIEKTRSRYWDAWRRLSGEETLRLF